MFIQRILVGLLPCARQCCEQSSRGQSSEREIPFPDLVNIHMKNLSKKFLLLLSWPKYSFLKKWIHFLL